MYDIEFLICLYNFILVSLSVAVTTNSKPRHVVSIVNKKNCLVIKFVLTE